MKGSMLNSPLLFSASLEAHMSAYADEIKLQSYNEQYQLAQMNIIRECERNNLNQLETILRIEAMNQELKKSLEVSYGDTAPPAIQSQVEPIKISKSPEKQKKIPKVEPIKISKSPEKQKKIPKTPTEKKVEKRYAKTTMSSLNKNILV